MESHHLHFQMHNSEIWSNIRLIVIIIAFYLPSCFGELSLHWLHRWIINCYCKWLTALEKYLQPAGGRSNTSTKGSKILWNRKMMISCYWFALLNSLLCSYSVLLRWGAWKRSCSRRRQAVLHCGITSGVFLSWRLQIERFSCLKLSIWWVLVWRFPCLRRYDKDQFLD